MAQGKPRLVIVGSGWAGFYISQHIDLSIYSPIIISPRRTSAYTPLLASAATGLFNFYLAEDSVRSKSRSLVKFIKANVLDVDFSSKSVHCAPAFEEDEVLSRQEFTVDYDILILAPGCEPNTFNTPGIRKQLFDLLEKASLPNVSDQHARDLLHIAIVGGGPTGIEITAELSDLCKSEIADLYPDVAKFMTISIYDVAKNILSAYDTKLHDYATQRLVDRGIDVATGTVIEEVGRDYLTIKGRGRNVSLVEKLDVLLNDKGLKRIQTDDRLRVFIYQSTPEGEKPTSIHPNVYALGDAADITHASLPTTAEVAVQKAKYLHDGVIAGKGPDHPGWTGQAAWLAWRSGSLMWNRNWRSRFAIVLTWALNKVFGSEIAKI
ncbi:External alternative NAD(P)H-ubiquinone oxido B1, mitochondrial [Cyphellophora attinorum]|uniref:External alternative NAD(P)H-ubiquinone oxido B1, mitochondrial n=1 Tax=Cyphellophora attinorum TaxID=1664694 RepID=A0A0N1HER0_9EURO|nr:External alternative NAD(P)H-ubiquinone oxido B1, mitochondrial [Phialophora attinorum]KPI43992.1 External alternative NAD(P)H-ubiquinone oxido B1, mitochondrial [Phialophora attinorum]